MNYRLFLPDGVIPSTEPSALIELMREAWPSARILVSHPKATSNYSLGWSIIFNPEVDEAIGSPFVTGLISKDSCIVEISGDFEKCVDFALWYRFLLPKEKNIMFEDEEEHYQIRIAYETNKKQIIKAFEPNLDVLSWGILVLLKRNNGSIVLNRLIEEITKQYGDKYENISIVDINKVIDQLWRQNLISSPGVKWLSHRPEEIADLITNPSWQDMQLNLTEESERALAARLA